MNNKKSEIKTNKQYGRLILNGLDISKNITKYIVMHEAGERPQLIIYCRPENLDLILNDLKQLEINAEIKYENGDKDV